MAAETNRRLAELLHGDTHWLGGEVRPVEAKPAITVVGGITSEAEEDELLALNDWVETQELPRGALSYDYASSETGAQQAVFDLVWPNGIQEELSQPVAVLLNESADTLALASRAGFRCFTTVGDFKAYVQKEILAIGVGA